MTIALFNKFVEKLQEPGFAERFTEIGNQANDPAVQEDELQEYIFSKKLTALMEELGEELGTGELTPGEDFRRIAQIANMASDYLATLHRVQETDAWLMPARLQQQVAKSLRNSRFSYMTLFTSQTDWRAVSAQQYLDRSLRELKVLRSMAVSADRTTSWH